MWTHAVFPTADDEAIAGEDFPGLLEAVPGFAGRLQKAQVVRL
jgi:hypothetical protein